MNNKLSNNKKQEFKREALLYLDPLYNLSLKITRNPEEAKDLVQETYYIAYRLLHHFQQGTSLKAWLFKILSNSFLTLYPKRVKEPKIIEYENVERFIDLMQEDNDSNIAHVEEDNFINKFSTDDVASALNQLPYDFKIAILLSDMEGFSYKEIADILECPIQTVRMRISNGRKILQNNLFSHAFK